jgi:hypothetical protein
MLRHIAQSGTRQRFAGDGRSYVYWAHDDGFDYWVSRGIGGHPLIVNRRAHVEPEQPDLWSAP